MKDKIFGVLQRVGRSFMLPIAILPVAGLLLGVGGSFTNATMLETYGLLDVMGPGTIPYAIFRVMSQAGDIVFANLPIIFAMGVAIGMATMCKNEFTKAAQSVLATNPELAETLMNTGSSIVTITMCAVLVYELVGPVLTKWALTKAGEIEPEMLKAGKKKVA